MSTSRSMRAALDPPGLTPADYGDQEQHKTSPEQIGSDGTRSISQPLAPGTFQERRVEIANRASPQANWTPAAAYMGVDFQKGGAPGNPGGDPPGTDSLSATNFITSQGPTGVTTPGGAPASPIKLAYGWSDYSSHYPTFVGAHLKIQWNANPNKPQLNPTPFTYEGPQANTRYSTPSPFAAGTFIG